MTARRAAIIGVGQTRYQTRHEESTLPELAQQAALLALDDAGLKMRDLDAVVFSLAPTVLCGVDSAERWAADYVGAVGLPYMRIHTGGPTGASAAQAGFYHVASGRFECVLVVGAEKVTESRDSQRVLNKTWDPVSERLVPLNAIAMCSLQATRHMQRYGTTREQMARVAVRSRANAARNPFAHLRDPITLDDVLGARLIAWPFGLLDCCPRSSGGCAVVIAGEEVVGRSPGTAAWMNGVAACTSTYYIGDRMRPEELDYCDFDDLAKAAYHAYAMAGIRDPRTEIDVCEIYAPFTSTELAAIEALGLCPKGSSGPLQETGMFDLGGDVPINPSGGVLCANPIGITALVRVAEAALQVRGAAGERQVESVRTAVATGFGGASDAHTVIVLGSRPK
jgi:acetyl-CoA C-acetyltransferase